MSKNQLLQVEYKEDQGLAFQWHYANMSTEAVYFRHLIVVFGEEKEEANAHLKKYIKKIKGGDFYYVLFTNRNREIRHVGWKEKAVVDKTPQTKSIIREEIAIGNREQIMSQVEDFYNEFSEPIVLTFFLSNLDDKEYLEARVAEKRFHGKYDFFVAFFAPVEKSTLSFGHRLSTFSTSKEESGSLVDYFLSNVYQAGLVYAKLTVECRNGSITSMADSNWRTTSFNQVERVYRGPSIKYDRDILFFYNRNLEESYEDLTLRLEFVTLEKKMYRTEKRLSVFSSKAFYQKTFNMDPWLKSYHASKDIWLTENPFSTFTVIKFEGNTSSPV